MYTFIRTLIENSDYNDLFDEYSYECIECSISSKSKKKRVYDLLGGEYFLACYYEDDNFKIGIYSKELEERSFCVFSLNIDCKVPSFNYGVSDVMKYIKHLSLSYINNLYLCSFYCRDSMLIEPRDSFTGSFIKFSLNYNFINTSDEVAKFDYVSNKPFNLSDFALIDGSNEYANLIELTGLPDKVLTASLGYNLYNDEHPVEFEVVYGDLIHFDIPERIKENSEVSISYGLPKNSSNLINTILKVSTEERDDIKCIKTVLDRKADLIILNSLEDYFITTVLSMDEPSRDREDLLNDLKSYCDKCGIRRDDVLRKFKKNGLFT